MTADELEALAARITSTDEGARAEAETAFDKLDAGELGRLRRAGMWWAAVTGTCPPAPPQRSRMFVFTDDGLLPASLERVAGALNRPVRAQRADAGYDDVAVALQAGVDLAESEADGGTDLLLLAAPHGTAVVPSVIVIAAITGADGPAMVTSRGVDDATWMTRVAAVRDGLRRNRKAPADPLSLLASAGGTELAYLTGLLLGAAARRTPVVIEGLAPIAAALIAHRVSADALGWLVPAHADSDPAAAAAFKHLDVYSLLSLGLEPGQGVASVLCLPVLEAAAALLGGGPADG
ncbi:MAG: nicotinate-nucleotide--dimethylbenzimidazole phosphoribosyltransferase [Sporichthyaceae bacterium]